MTELALKLISGDRGALVEEADQVKQQLTVGLGDGQIAALVENDEVHAGQIVRHGPPPR